MNDDNKFADDEPGQPATELRPRRKGIYVLPNAITLAALFSGFYGIVMAMPLLTGACAQRFDTTRLGVPVTMASESATPPAGARFSVTTRSVWALWGMLPVKEPSLEDALAGQARAI